MRYALMILLLIGFTCLVAGFSVQAQAPPATEVRHVVTQDRTGTHFTITGPFQTTRDDAWRAALERARSEIVDQLRSEGILVYEPDPDYIHTRLLRSSREEEKDLGPPVGKMRRIVLDISINPQQRAEIVLRDQQRQNEIRQAEHRARVQDRMKSSAIVLLALVTVLGAVAGYLRLEEMTKGYYTGWLLAAAGVVGSLAVMGVVLYLYLA